jgi:hypothetical protein
LERETVALGERMRQFGARQQQVAEQIKQLNPRA